MAKEQASGDVVVTVRKDRGGDRDGIANGPPGGITTAVDLRLNLFNDYALATFNWFHSTQFQKNFVDVLVTFQQNMFSLCFNK